MKKLYKIKVTRRRFLYLFCVPILAWGILAASFSLFAADVTVTNTLPATNVTGSSAALQGSVDSVEGVIEKGFEYGTSPSYGSVVEDTNAFGYHFARNLNECCNKDGQLSYAQDVAASTSGDIYIADEDNKRIQKFDQNGNYLTQWGSGGSNDGQFSGINSLAVDSAGNVYVAERFNRRIQKFDQNGNYLTQWGSNTDDVNDFPYIAVDSQDNVYVTTGNIDGSVTPPIRDPRIQKFDSTGTLLTEWSLEGHDNWNVNDLFIDGDDRIYVNHAGSGYRRYDSVGNYLGVVHFGGLSSRVFFMNDAFYSIAYQAPQYYQIQKFDQNGNFIETVADNISSYGSFRSFTVDLEENFYVLYADDVLKYGQDGDFLDAWGRVGDDEGDEVFRTAQSYWFDSDGNFYVADERRVIRKYDAAGNYLLQWEVEGSFGASIVGLDEQNNLYAVSTSAIYVFDSRGNELDNWLLPDDSTKFLAVDPGGNVYAAYPSENIIYKLDSSGNELLQWGEAGSGNGQFDNPSGIAVALNGDIYIADTGNNRVQKFDQNGNYLAQWGSQGFGFGQFDWPRAVAVDDEGSVYVSDYSQNRVQKFDQNGNFITVVRRDLGAEYFGEVRNIVINNQNGDVYAFSSESGDGARTRVYQYGAFATELEDLNCNTTYYYRAYAVTTEGTLYGDQETFQTTGCGMFVSITSPSDEAELELGLNTITGTGPSNEELEILLNGDVIGMTTTDSGGNWTHDLTLSSTGSYTLDARWTPSGDIAFIPYADMSTLAGAIQVINTQTYENIINIPLSPELGVPISVTLNHAKTKLYVTTIAVLGGPGKLLEIDLSTMEIRSVDTAGEHAFQAAVSPDDTTAYVLSVADDGNEGTNYVQQYSLAEMSVTGDPILELGAAGFNQGIPFPRIALNTTGSKLYVVGIRHNPPLVIDTATAVVTPLDWGVDPEYSVADLIIRGDVGYVAPYAMEDCQIRIIDLISDTVTQVITMPACENTDVITKLAVSNTQDLLYAIGLIGLYELDLQETTSSQLTSWPEKYTFGAGLTSDGAQLYLPAAMGGGLSVWDTQANEWIDDGSGGLLPLDAVAYSFGDRFIGTIAPVSDQISFSVAEDDNSDAFITTWKTDNPGESNDNQITIPTIGGGYNYSVTWEEVGNPDNSGTVGPFTSGATITFPSAGIYKISITGDFPRIYLNGVGDTQKILTVEQWGSGQWNSMEAAFYGASNLVITAIDAPDLSNVTDMTAMFISATSFNSDINHWDTSNVNNMASMFRDTSFNQPLDNWDVSNVTDMGGLFDNTPFNQDIDSWDVSNVTNMWSMFANTSSFNQPLSSWNTSSVVDMSRMFDSASSFNQPLDNWNVSGVEYMNSMLYNTGLSTENYDATLAAWSTLELQSNVSFTAFPTQYCDAAEERQHIINTFNWTIQDGGNACAEASENDPFVTIASPEDGVELEAGSNAITGTGPRNQEIEILLDDDVVGTTIVNGDGDWTYSLNVPSTGSYTLDARWTPGGDIAFVPYMDIGEMSSAIRVIDTETQEVIKNIALPAGAAPLSVTLNHAKTKLYVVGAELLSMQSRVWEIDLDTMNINQQIGLDMLALQVAVSPGDTVVYVLSSDMDSSSHIQQYDASTNLTPIGEPVSIAGVLGVEASFTLNEAGTKLYLTKIQDLESSPYMFTDAVIDTATGTLTLLDWVSGYSYAATSFTIANNVGYATVMDNDGCRVLVIDISTDAITQTINVPGCVPVLLSATVVDGSGQKLYMTAADGLYVVDIQDQTSSLLTTLPDGYSYGASLTSDGTQLYLVGSDGYTENILVRIWDTQTNEWIDDGSGGLLPAGVAGYSLGSNFVSPMAPVGDQISFSVTGESEDPDAFITTWKTDNPGGSNDNQIIIPTHPYENYNYTVEWEEVGNPDNNGTAGPFTGDGTITFPSAGTYKVSIIGDFPRIYFSVNDSDREKILTVEQWGTNQWLSMGGAFSGAINLQIPATDAPDLSNVTDMNSMFSGATSFNSNINNWDVSGITDMYSMFRDATSFNQPLNNWDTSSVTNMREMFSHATSFNQPIGSWDITSVNDIYLMFWHASSFNQPLDTWDVSGLTDIGSVFLDATSFNQPLNNWDVSGITGMASTFSGATSFNQPLDNWDVSNVVFMNSMFSWASSFNQPLNSWDVSSAVNMNNMFAAAESFNQPLNSWDVSNVQEMGAMFANTISFNQPLDNWDVSGATSMYQMFSISAFDQSLASWDVSNVEDMFMMFGNLDAVIEEYMEGIPYEDWPQQYQDLYGLPASGLSTENYDATLTAWSQLTLQDDVTFDAGTSTYCDATSQRQSIIDTFAWTINDSGENCEDEEEPTDPETPGGSTPPTRPTTPPSTVTPDEPPVVPVEDDQPGVAEERTPEDEDEAAVVRDEDGLESEPGGGSTTPRRPGGEAVQGRENFVARTLDGVASFFGVSPIAVAQAFPWLLIILLLLLALVTAIKVIQQLFVIAKTRKLVARQALLNHEKKSLISLATHYLRTPLTILSSGIEMLPTESTARQAISKATAGLKVTVDKLIGQIETNKNLVNLAEPSKPLHRRTSLLQPAIFVPTLLTLGLVLGANILVAVATTFDPGWQHIGAQIVGVLIVGGLFYVAYDHHRQKKTLQAYEQQLLKHEEGLDVARNQFVKGMADTLVPAVVAVDTAVPAGLPEDTTKFLKEGLRQLEHTVGDFILIGQLEKQILKQRATSVAVRDTVSRAQQQLKQSDAQLSVNIPADTTVHQPQFLLHKVFGSLIDNAVAHNKPNTPAEVTSKQGKAITAIEVTDYGEGIPEDKLSLLFKPLSRVQTAEDFTHQGIGLSLYVSRLIMHYLGGDISAASKVGKGTTMQVKVPNQMEV